VTWVKAYKAVRLGEVAKRQSLLTEIEMELARTKKLVETKIEWAILNKVAAYFAKESLPDAR